MSGRSKRASTEAASADRLQREENAQKDVPQFTASASSTSNKKAARPLATPKALSDGELYDKYNYKKVPLLRELCKKSGIIIDVGTCKEQLVQLLMKHERQQSGQAPPASRAPTLSDFCKDKGGTLLRFGGATGACSFARTPPLTSHGVVSVHTLARTPPSFLSRCSASGAVCACSGAARRCAN